MRATIGRHGTLTADQARPEAKRLLGLVASGHDPAEERDKTKAVMNMGSVLEQFLSEHADAKLKPRSAEEYRRLARLYVLPAFRHRRVGDMKRCDVVRLHHGLKNKPYQANRTLALLSKFFNWCEKNGLRPDGSAVEQTVRPLVIEGMDSVSERLPIHAANPCRIGMVDAVTDRRQATTTSGSVCYISTVSQAGGAGWPLSRCESEWLMTSIYPPMPKLNHTETDSGIYQ